VVCGNGTAYGNSSRCSGGLEASSIEKLIEIVCNLLIEAVQLGAFMVLEFGVGPVRSKQPGGER
jgi:hypothetical protein